MYLKSWMASLMYRTQYQNITLTLFKTKYKNICRIISSKEDFVSASHMPNILVSFKIFTRMNLIHLFEKEQLRTIRLGKLFLVTLVCFFTFNRHKCTWVVERDRISFPLTTTFLMHI